MSSENPTRILSVGMIDIKLEVVVLPVSDDVGKPAGRQLIAQGSAARRVSDRGVFADPHRRQCRPRPRRCGSVPAGRPPPRPAKTDAASILFAGSIEDVELFGILAATD
jgi:hypothetical protein